MGIHQDDHFPFQLAMSSLDSDMSTLTRPESFEPKAAGAIKKQQTFMCVCAWSLKIPRKMGTRWYKYMLLVRVMSHF